MNFEIVPTQNFMREFKRLSKKYRSLNQDMAELGRVLSSEPESGIAIGHNCFKVRLAISSKNKGKSGGGRVITLVRVEKERVYLLTVYDKSEQEDISEARLKMLIQAI